MSPETMPFTQHIETWSLLPPQPIAGSPVSLELAGQWPSCLPITHDLTWLEDGQALLLLHPGPGGCGGSVTPWQGSFPLGELPQGEFQIEVATHGFAGSTPDSPYSLVTVAFSVRGAQEIPALAPSLLGLFAALLAAVAFRRLRRTPS
jgi:hypothetical protein